MTRTAPAPDISSWPTKSETSELLQVSFRTLDKFVTDGKLQSAKRPQSGKPPATVYHPDDVERLRLAKQPAAHVMPTPNGTGTHPAQLRETVGLTARSGAADGFMAFLEILRAHLAQPAESLPQRLFLTLREAVDYSGLPQGELLRAIKEGKLGARKTWKGWRIRRKDLEEL